MSSFLAKLTFYEGEQDSQLAELSHNVLECSFEFNVGTDRRGKRTENVKGGLISLVIESGQKEDFLQWIKDPNENRTGELVFYKRDMMASAMTLYFSGADCIHYSEEFNATGDVPMKTRIVIAPIFISMGETDVTLREEVKNN